MTHEDYMRLALSAANKGIGFVNPNPLVGAVIVKDGKIIGQGYHEKYGEPHAERNALANCTENPNESTLYVTLEPCCHYGKTPPCTEAIIQSGISKVVVGLLDPNPLVSGKGIMALTSAGIKVHVGVLSEECRQQNEVFLHYIKTKTPFVVMKYAMTMDGKIATCANQSKWITAEQSRANVQLTRHKYSAIMVGVGTVIADNPQLTCRIPTGKNPVRIICDTHLRTPLDAIVVQTANKVRTILATACTNKKLHTEYLRNGCEVLVIPLQDKHIDLQYLMKSLGEMGIDSILLEGGSELNFSAVQSQIVNKVHTYIAPKLFGGKNAKTPIGGAGFPEILSCVTLKNQKLLSFGDDLFIESEVDYSCLQEL